MRILQTFCFSALFIALQSHAAVYVTVTTFDDENGENASKCSLREAITAVNIQQEFGGCPAGDRFLTNIIALNNGTYTLSHGELVSSHAVTIQGVETALKNEIDPIFRIKSKRVPPSFQRGSRIDGNFQSRLLNSAASKSAITLNNVMLLNGKANIGGAVLVGGQLNINSSVISNNSASTAGGAIYLEGRDAAIISTDSTWSKNTVPTGKGAVLAMSCVDDLKSITRNLDIIRNSIIDNGSLTDKSIIDGCSSVNFNIESSTVAQNTAKDTGGILFFAEKLASGSNLTLSHVTVVDNKVAPALTYGNLSTLNITSSIVAFNNGSGCFVQSPSSTKYTGTHNAYQNCVLANSDSDKNEGDKLDKHPDVTLSQELMPLGDYGGYTLSYLPKSTTTYLVTTGSAPDCDQYIDQRNSSVNHCNIGSVEKRTAITVSDNTLTTTNKDDTDRIAEVDALSNDIPSETELVEGTPNARGDFTKDIDGNYDDKAITITAGGDKCQVIKPTTAGERPIIRFDNLGVVIKDEPYICKYKFTDANGQLSTEGEVLFRIENRQPIANNDTYILPSNVQRILLDLASNDNDKNDGKYGGLCTANDLKCNEGRFIRVVTQPVLGIIEADKEGSCPDSNEINRYTCFGGNIYYRIKNASSPFNDKFTYVVYDIDKTASNDATVTIINQTGENEKENSGAFGLFSLLGLSGLAFYRRFRK